MGLPRELRDQIYEFVWCEPGCARLTQQYLEDQMHDPYDSGPTFPEAVAFPYPPKESTEESDTEDDPEAVSENWLDCLSASDEDEDEIEARAALRAEPLAPINDGEDSTDEEEELDSDEEDAGKLLFPTGHGFLADLSGCGYGEDELETLILVTPLHTGLLYVNKQVSEETLPIFYRNTTLVLDADGYNCMQFILRLSRATRRRITSLAITNGPLMGDDGPSRRAWSGSNESPLYRGADGLTLVTPFATTLAKNLPNLEEFSLFVPWSGDCDWYCTWATTELSMMLKYNRIQQLNHVFFGEKAAKALQKDSDACYEELMGGLADGAKLAKHEFALRDPHPTGPYTNLSRKKGQQWMRREEAYLEEHQFSFAWGWADRGLDMGMCGNVQAVVACYNDDA